MLRIKRLYSFVLQTFLPLLVVTFGVCLFVILMQFLWKYVDDMVGKGIEMQVLAKMFFYAGLALVPMALPLSILLASLISFGNLGEQLELLAMKSAGVSLLRIMKPIIIVLIFVAGAAFYFQNNILPISQVKLYTMLLSMKQKSPELDIPEGSFYQEINGYNVYVRHKARKGGMLYDVMIYNYSKGFENAAVIVADSGKLKASDSKLYLILTLHSGESFENLRSQAGASANSEKIPYRREKFSLKEILIEFDANFNMADESLMQGRDIGKNLPLLRHFIDSVKVDRDSVNMFINHSMHNYTYSEPLGKKHIENGTKQNTGNEKTTIVINNFDDYFSKNSLTTQADIVSRAKSKAEFIHSDYYYKAINQEDQNKGIRSHQIELHRKFTLSFACLIFFFIGAPLGAIIRKGGLGMPTVISIVLFLFYYTIDIFGIKMASQGVLPIWQGMWLSSSILLPLGIFFTYKAVNDSVMLNPDAWKDAFKRFIGKSETRNYQKKEVIMENPDYNYALSLVNNLDQQCSAYLKNINKPLTYLAFLKNGFADQSLENISNSMEEMIEYLRNSEENLIIGKLMDYPVLKILNLHFLDKKPVKWIYSLIIPLGIMLYCFRLYWKKQTVKNIMAIQKIDHDLTIEMNKLGKNYKLTNIQ